MLTATKKIKVQSIAYKLAQVSACPKAA